MGYSKPPVTSAGYSKPSVSTDGNPVTKADGNAGANPNMNASVPMSSIFTFSPSTATWNPAPAIGSGESTDPTTQQAKAHYSYTVKVRQLLEEDENGRRSFMQLVAQPSVWIYTIGAGLIAYAVVGKARKRNS